MSRDDFWETISSFQVDAHYLLEAKSDEDFLNWVKVLYVRDKRSLYLYLKKYASQIPKNRLILIFDLFPKPIL